MGESEKRIKQPQLVEANILQPSAVDGRWRRPGKGGLQVFANLFPL
jgi:hypothetical protein